MNQHSSIRYDCTICSYSALNQQCLRNYIRIKHLSEKPHKCSHCDNSFKLKNTNPKKLRNNHSIAKLLLFISHHIIFWIKRFHISYYTNSSLSIYHAYDPVISPILNMEPDLESNKCMIAYNHNRNGMGFPFSWHVPLRLSLVHCFKKIVWIHYMYILNILNLLDLIYSDFPIVL